MKVLPDVYLSIARAGDIPGVSDFSAILQQSSLQDSDFTSDEFKPGQTGQSALERRLRQDLGL
jgi:hypothetical protein